MAALVSLEHDLKISRFKMSGPCLKTNTPTNSSINGCAANTPEKSNTTSRCWLNANSTSARNCCAAALDVIKRPSACSAILICISTVYQQFVDSAFIAGIGAKHSRHGAEFRPLNAKSPLGGGLGCSTLLRPSRRILRHAHPTVTVRSAATILTNSVGSHILSDFKIKCNLGNDITLSAINIILNHLQRQA